MTHTVWVRTMHPCEEGMVYVTNGFSAPTPFTAIHCYAVLCCAVQNNVHSCSNRLIQTLESGAVEKAIDVYEGCIAVEIIIALCITSTLIANSLSMDNSISQ